LTNNSLLVSIVVASLRFDYLRILIKSIDENTRSISHEIVLVTPGEPPEDIAERCVVIHDGGVGCVAAYNLGFRAAIGKYIININDDCFFCPNAIPNMLNFINDEDVQGAFYICEPDREGWITNSLFGKLYANFGMVKKSLLEKVGYWSPEFVHYGADVDVSLSFWAHGIMVAATPDARVIHLCINDEHRKEHLRDAAGTKLQEKWRGIFYFP
jgi:GT2 family glycosyltransferase